MSEIKGPAPKRRLVELQRRVLIRIVPRGRDSYARLDADVFVKEQNVANVSILEGY